MMIKTLCLETLSAQWYMEFYPRTKLWQVFSIKNWTLTGFLHIELDHGQLCYHPIEQKKFESLNLKACNKDLEIMVEMLDRGVVELRREWKTTNESPSKIVVLIPISQPNYIPSSITLTSVRTWVSFIL